MECGSQGVRTPPGFERGESPLFSCLKFCEKPGFWQNQKKFQKQRLNNPPTGGRQGLSMSPRRAVSPTVSGFQRFFAKFEISEKPLKIGDYYRGLFGGYLGVI